MAMGNYLPQVRAQYEQLPYPSRNPQDEHKRLLRTHGDDLEYLNHFGFAGKLPLSGMRVLDAGAGSGDASIYLAEQLREFGGEVVHLDMSEASINIARERAAIRGLNNIEFIHASLLDLANLQLGEFDYITCSGVLHHLQRPEAGLEALLTALKPQGVLKIMVYGQYGRLWVYHMQELMRRINRDVAADDFDRKLENCKQVMQLLKGTSWFTALENSVNDIKTMGDVGIFDLFLHSQDRAYTIPELYELVESAGLVLHHYIPAPYVLDPRFIATDNPIKSLLLKREKREQQAIMEMMNGKIKKHFCYAIYGARPFPSPDDDRLVPDFSTTVDGLPQAVHKAAADDTKERMKIKSGDRKIDVGLNPARRALLGAIDGKRSIAQIVAAAANHLGASAADDELKQEFAEIYEVLHNSEWMFLRHPDLPRFPTMTQMQARLAGSVGGKNRSGN